MQSQQPVLAPSETPQQLHQESTDRHIEATPQPPSDLIQQKESEVATPEHIQPETNEEQVQEQTIAKEDLPDRVQKTFSGGLCTIQKRKYSLRIHLHFPVPQQRQPSSIQDLFPQKKEPMDVKLTISFSLIDPEIKKLFPSLSDIHHYFANFIGNNKKVEITPQLITIKNKEKDILINFNELSHLQKTKNIVKINLQRIDQKLDALSERQWQLIEEESRKVHEEDHVYAGIQDKDLQEVLEDCGLFFDEQMEIESAKSFIEAEKEQIDLFNNKFDLILKKIIKPAEATKTSVVQRPYQPKANLVNKQSPFPPGYVPPHLAKPKAPDGLASEDALRIGAANTKKEKLKMAKDMLNMGYSGDQVIKRLEQIERGQGRGRKSNGNTFKPQPKVPVKPQQQPKDKVKPTPFHLKAQQTQPKIPMKPMEPEKTPFQQQRSEPPKSKDRQVKLMLIKLLKQRRYKKVDEICRHMKESGLQTTPETVKRLFDQIKARNAQRKKQSQLKEAQQ